MVETSNLNANLSEIPEMPVFRPTEEEFKHPLSYIDKLFHEQDVHKFGCIKVVPPKSFKPTNYFDMKSNRKLPSRIQIMQKLS